MRAAGKQKRQRLNKAVAEEVTSRKTSLSALFGVGKPLHIKPKDLYRKVRDMGGDDQLVIKAINIIKDDLRLSRLHRSLGYERLDGYKHHVALAYRVAKMGLFKNEKSTTDKTKAVLAVLLQEYVACSAITHNEVIREFGREVANLVDSLASLTRLPIRMCEADESGQLNLLAINFNRRQEVLLPGIVLRDENAGILCLLKLTDAYHQLLGLNSIRALKNTDSTQPISLEKLRCLAARNIDELYLGLVRALAQRFDVAALQNDMQRRLFTMLDPEAEKSFQKQYHQIASDLQVEKLLRIIEKSLKKKKYDLSSVVKKAVRRKEPYAAWKKRLDDEYEKMKEKTDKEDYTNVKVDFCTLSDPSLETIHDILGFRFVLKTGSDIEKLEKILSELFEPIYDRRKDFLGKNKKKNGYEALHNTFYLGCGKKVEIQMVDERMERENKKSHDHYKLRPSDEYEAHPAFIFPQELKERLVNIERMCDQVETLLQGKSPPAFVVDSISLVCDAVGTLQNIRSSWTVCDAINYSLACGGGYFDRKGKYIIPKNGESHEDIFRKITEEWGLPPSELMRPVRHGDYYKYVRFASEDALLNFPQPFLPNEVRGPSERLINYGMH